jgi:hypothetical protein
MELDIYDMLKGKQNNLGYHLLQSFYKEEQVMNLGHYKYLEGLIHLPSKLNRRKIWSISLIKIIKIC